LQVPEILSDSPSTIMMKKVSPVSLIAPVELLTEQRPLTVFILASQESFYTLTTNRKAQGGRETNLMIWSRRQKLHSLICARN